MAWSEHHTWLLGKAITVAEGQPLPWHVRDHPQESSRSQLNENETSFPWRVQLLSCDLGSTRRQHWLQKLIWKTERPEYKSKTPNLYCQTRRAFLRQRHFHEQKDGDHFERHRDSQGWGRHWGLGRTALLRLATSHRWPQVRPTHLRAFELRQSSSSIHPRGRPGPFLHRALSQANCP